MGERPVVNVYHVCSFFRQYVKQAKEVTMHASIGGDCTRREREANDGIGPPVMVPFIANSVRKRLVVPLARRIRCAISRMYNRIV